MIGCHDNHDLLLDYVYGLVEADEAEAVRLHVSDCADCRTALEEAQVHQGMFARAAQMYRQVPEFVPPGSEIQPRATEETRTRTLAPAPSPAPSPAAAVVTLPPRRRYRLARWGSLAAAAALLLSAIGLYHLYDRGLADYQGERARSTRQLDQVRVEFAEALRAYEKTARAVPERVRAQAEHALKDAQETEAKKALTRGERKLTEAEAELADRLSAQSVLVQVLGPKELQTDAPSSIRIMTCDVLGNALPAKVDLDLVAQDTKTVLYRQKDVPTTGEINLLLPPGIAHGVRDASLQVAARTQEGGGRVEETLKIAEPTLVTHVALNKAAYQVGELVMFRTVTLERFSLRPVTEPIPLRFTLIDAQGRVRLQRLGQTGEGGIASSDLALTDDLTSGAYVFEVAEANGKGRLLPQRRRVDILRDVEVQFDRAKYRAGEDGVMVIRRRGAPGGEVKGAAPDNQTIIVTQIMDNEGKHVPPPGAPAVQQLRADDYGNAAIKFKVPDKLEAGRPVLELEFPEAKRDQKVVQPIPVTPTELVVDFFPEGGELLAGVPNRVYYRARSPLGEPADPEGHVIVLSSKEVILDSPRNQGLGVFTFIPQADEKYTLRVTSPHHVSEQPNPFAKFAIRKHGVALNVPAGVSREDEPLNLVVHNTGSEQRLLAVAVCRGRVVDQRFLVARHGKNEVALAPVPGANGVVRLTLYEPRARQLHPLAERLVYRVPARALQLAVSQPGQNAVGDHVRLGVEAQDKNGQPVTGWAVAAVVDSRVAGRQEPGLRAHFYLATEINHPEELENADFLVADNPQARHALDLFLGTQGWRRFVERDDEMRHAPLAQNKKDAGDKKGEDSAAIIPHAIFSRQNASRATALAKLQDEWNEKAKGPRAEQLAALQAQVAQELTRIQARFAAEAEVTIAHGLAQAHAELARQRAELERDQQTYEQAARLAALQLQAYQNRPRDWLRLGAGLLALSLLTVGALFVIIGMVRLARRHATGGACAGGLACLSLCLVLYLLAGHLPAPETGTKLVASRPLPPLPEIARQTRPVSPLALPEAERLIEVAKVAAKLGQLPAGDAATYFHLDLAKAAPPTGVFADADIANRRPFPTSSATPGTRPELSTLALLRNMDPDARSAGVGAGGYAPPTAPADVKEGGKSEPKSAMASDLRARFADAKDAQFHDQFHHPQVGKDMAKKGKTSAGKEKEKTAREYVFSSTKNDFQDTVLWHPALLLKDGRAEVAFDLPRQLTNYRVLINAHTADGRLGSYQGTLEVRSKSAK